LPASEIVKVLRITFGGIPRAISGSLFAKIFSLARDIRNLVFNKHEGKREL
jgi:hypothetical protein